MVAQYQPTNDAPAASKSGAAFASETDVDEDFDAMKQDVDRIVDAAADEARRLGEHAKAYGAAFAEGQKRGVAEAIADVAASLRETAETLTGRPNLQSILEQASDNLDSLAETVGSMSFADLYEEAEAFSRARPVLVGACALFAGFAMARFIKSSADRSGSDGHPGFQSYQSAGRN